MTNTGMHVLSPVNTLLLKIFFPNNCDEADEEFYDVTASNSNVNIRSLYSKQQLANAAHGYNCKG